MERRTVTYKKDNDKGQLLYEKNHIIQPLKNLVPPSPTGRRRGIKLPKYITYTITDKTLYLYIQEQQDNTGAILNATCANMQTDNAAFEGWAITLKAWLPEKIEEVSLKWDIPSPVLRNEHYNRFLYRCIRFREHYAWFHIDPNNEPCLTSFMNDEFHDLRINVSNTEPQKKSNNENTVEYEFCDSSNTTVRSKLLEHYHMDLFNHQLHVGIHNNEKPIFTGKQSAIDLWGINHDTMTMSIIELKYIDKASATTDKNIKVGIISELFFYLCIIEDLIHGSIKNDTPILQDEKELYTHIREIKNINAIMLSNEYHPLVDSTEVIRLLNDTANPTDIHIHFKQSLYEYNIGSYKLANIHTIE